MIISIMNTIGALARRASTAASIITENLQMWLGFTSSSWVGGELVVLDESTNTNNAKLFTGKALSFDGVNDYVSIPLITGVETISMWVNGSTNSDSVLGTVGWSPYFNFNFGNNGTVYGSAGNFTFPNIPTATWLRLVITRDSTGLHKAYLNGLKSTVELTSSWGLDFKFIGARNYGTVWNGELSDVQFYDSVWSQSDVDFDYANPNHLVIDNVGNTTITKANLVGYWALSEGSGSIAYDSSGGGNNGTINGATFDDKQPTIPQLGMMDWSKPMLFSFSNIGDYISLGTGYDYGSTTTISMFVSADTLTSRYEGIFGSKFNTNGEFIILKQGTTGLMVGVNTCYVVIPNVLVNNTMQFISVVYNPSESGNDRIKVYVDGGSALTAAITGTVSGNLRNDANNLKIGSPATYAPVSGYIGEVSVFSTAMDSTEISELYNGGAIKNATTHSESASLEGYWKNDGLSTWLDLSTNSNNGTVVGSPETMTLIQNPNDIGKDVLGNSLRLREGGFNLDGSGYAEVADSTSLNITTAITLAAWVKWSDINDKGIVTRWTGSNLDFMLYKKSTSNSSTFAMYIGSTSLTSSTIAGTGWVYIVGTYDGVNIKTYIDGSLDNTLAHTGAIPYHSDTVDIGRYGDSSSSYDNVIDDILIYDDALTATEILNNYNVGLPTHS